MNNNQDIKKKREEAANFFEEMYQSGTTLYAVANAKRENSAKSFDADDVISRFQKNLSGHLDVADRAIKKL